jgi:hypothetical protein
MRKIKTTPLLFITLLVQYASSMGQGIETNVIHHNTVLSGSCQGMVMFWPKDSWICPASDTVYFVSFAQNYAYLQWEKSIDSGLTWIEASPWKSTYGSATGNHERDTLFISRNDSVALTYMYRIKWTGESCTTLISPPVKVAPFMPAATMWTGYASNTYWSNPQNWCCGRLPNDSTDVIINENSDCIVDFDIIVKSLSITKSYIQIAPGINFKVIQ